MVIQPGTTSTSLLIRLKHDDAEAWERFDWRQSGSFRAWLRAIVENLLKDFYRHKENTEPTMIDEMLGNITQPTEVDLSEEKRLLYEQAVGIMRRDFCELRT